jgi:octaprenyl-diphosphate synthase
MAAAIELIHSASLVHDDIIDEAEKRRALLAVHRKYGTKIAILVGDILFTEAFSIVAALPDVDNDTKVRLFSILSDLTKRMCYGEIFEQKVIAESQRINKDDYIRILEFKTALLMSTAARCGAILGGADEPSESALASFGLNFGYAYQLVDDHTDHDRVFTGPLDLVTMAKEYVGNTKTDLAQLGASEAVRSMLNLAEFILP